MQTLLKNNYTHKYLTRDLSKFNSAIVLNDQKTVTNHGQTYKLDTHSEETLRDAIDYIHDLSNYFNIDKPVSDCITWQLKVIFKRGYITKFFNHVHYEAITIACLICSYQILSYPLDEMRILPYIHLEFKPDIRGTILSELNRSYAMLTELHQIEPNYILLTQFANYFNQTVDCLHAQPLYI